MHIVKRLLGRLRPRPKTAEQLEAEARALEAQRTFELSKARYRNR